MYLTEPTCKKEVKLGNKHICQYFKSYLIWSAKNQKQKLKSIWTVNYLYLRGESIQFVDTSSCSGYMLF